MSVSQEYVVAGLTGEAGTQTVTEEVLALPDVQEVSVALDGGAMTVTSTEPLEFATVSAAVSRAGCTLGSRERGGGGRRLARSGGV